MTKLPETATLIDETALGAEMAAIADRAATAGVDPRPELLAVLSGRTRKDERRRETSLAATGTASPAPAACLPWWTR